MHLPRILAFAGVGIVALAACGGTPAATTGTNTSPAPVGATPSPAGLPTQAVVVTPAPVGGTVDTCSLLTAAEISAATGETYTAGTLDASAECLWNVQGETANTGSLIIGFVQTVDLGYVKSAFGAGGSDATVNGHAAFWNPTQGLDSMWVDIGEGRVFTLSFPRSETLDSSYLPIAQGLAEIAVGRL